VNKEILKRIEESKKDYDKKTQRAQLLIRNKQFIKELKETPADFVVDSEDRLKFKTKKIDLGGVDVYINVESFSKFKNFCLRWHIHPTWDGNIDTLSEFIKDSPEIICEPVNYLLVNGHIYFPDKEIVRPEGLERINYLYIKVDAWTSLEDIKKIWPRIEEFQRTIFSYKAELKSNFSRDLCWYDLKTTHNLSYGKIAKLWIKHFHEDIDLLVIRRFKKVNEEFLKEKIQGQTSLMEDYSELLHMVKTGRLGEEIKSNFDEERKYYITGKTEHAKVTPRFIDAINKAVKRMQNYINQIYESPQTLISLPWQEELSSGENKTKKS